MKLVQQSSLSEELKYFEDNTGADEAPSNLQNKKKLKTQFSKTLLKCNPFVQDGILRVGGRLRNSGLPVDQKHPIILPPYHHILKEQSAVAKGVRDCVACNRRSAKVGEQWMADLPFSRVTAGNPPFFYTAVDLFGPVKVKLGQSEHKRYGCIFSCMATRTIHIEVVESLHTSAFLQAFFRFTSRCGKPAHVYSDNGSNLVAGSKAIADGINKWYSKQIDTSLSQKGIQWHFSPSLSSYQNGVVERMVQEVKRILRALLDGQFLNDYSLWSLLTGVEEILNDRPLTPLSDDPKNLNALSPNSILINRLEPSLPPDVFFRTDEYRRGYRHVQRLLDLFWQREDAHIQFNICA
ncbi:uncharacterized protein LOC144427229 [Styela clava]